VKNLIEQAVTDSIKDAVKRQELISQIFSQSDIDEEKTLILKEQLDLLTSLQKLCDQIY
jgi:hypothetical protein